MKTITTLREYDDKGRLVKETRTEVDRPEPAIAPPDPWWTRPEQGWWQNPVVSKYTINVSADTNPSAVAGELAWQARVGHG